MEPSALYKGERKPSKQFQQITFEPNTSCTRTCPIVQAAIIESVPPSENAWGARPIALTTVKRALHAPHTQVLPVSRLFHCSFHDPQMAGALR